MYWITEDARLVCKHKLGKVRNQPTQDLVTIAGRRVLIEPDPEGRSISGCPNIGLGIKPCTSTLKVREGYSEWIRIEGRSLCLDTVSGLTDGTPPGIVKYVVDAPGQDWVSER